MLKDRLLLSAEAAAGGDPGAGGGGGGAPPAADGSGNGAAPAAAPAWYAPAESLKTSDPEVWAKFEKSIQSGGHKDMASVVKHVIGLESKLGSAITLPGKDAKPEELAAAKAKLQQAGLLPVSPESPDKYEFPVDAIPESMRDATTIETVKAWAHKHGLSAEAVKELAEIELARYNGVVEPALKYTKEQGQAALDEYAKSVGLAPEAALAHAGNWLVKNFTEEEVKAMEAAGFANSPVAIKFAVRAGLDTGEDISVLPSGTAADTEFEEALKFTSDPKHPDYALWTNGNPEDPKRQALQAKYEAAFRKKFGTGEVK